MTEVGSEHRVALGVSNGSEGLRRKRRRIEELRQSLVTETRIANLIGTICSSTILWSCTVVEAVQLAIAFDGIVCASTGFYD